MLTNKTIVLGVTGGISAYKAAYIASSLTQSGASVKVVMTKSATQFIGPQTFSSLTNNKVITEMFESPSEPTVWHITLAREADVMVVAPATANIIAKLAAGIADDVLTATALATKAPVIIAPAMHGQMLRNPATQHNLATLRERGAIIIEPEYGRLAAGDIGPGRLTDPDRIIGAIKQALGKSGDMAGKRVVVTAGGTQEPIDPVRHIGNPSSGKMGYALAEAARDRGAAVTLITAPASLPLPSGIETIPVRTTDEMKTEVTKATAQADVLLMAAAVSDFRTKEIAKEKVKKDASSLNLELVRTPDILAGTTGQFTRVGFAAESENIVANAKEKLAKKQLDLIVANDITDAESGFGTDTNKVTLIDRNGNEETLPLLSKREVADKILDRVVGLLSQI
ncbi:bifunctional phosphopantothenoylcysteine decarboxylase/phosphopantothenate--cysteine ligase CoaBC [Bacteroidota bacterium]